MPPTHPSAPVSAQFATAVNVLPAAPAPDVTPSPLRDTLATLSAVAGVGGLVKIVLFVLTLVAGY